MQPEHAAIPGPATGSLHAVAGTDAVTAPFHDGPGTGTDPVVAAFQTVAEVGERTARDAEELARQSRRAGQDRAAGATVSETMASGRPQEILGLVEKMTKRLLGTGAGLRKSLVEGLAAEGWGVSAVARRFGVSHQRISALMQKSRPKNSGAT